nr:MAG TPA: hypothetical protein [Caudoviricetes sp.]
MRLQRGKNGDHNGVIQRQYQQKKNRNYLK